MTTRIVTDANGRKQITNEPLLHPPQRKPLTDEQLIAAYDSEQQGRYGDHIRSLRAIESKLKEKNGG